MNMPIELEQTKSIYFKNVSRLPKNEFRTFLLVCGI